MTPLPGQNLDPLNWGSSWNRRRDSLSTSQILRWQDSTKMLSFFSGLLWSWSCVISSLHDIMAFTLHLLRKTYISPSTLRCTPAFSTSLGPRVRRWILARQPSCWLMPLALLRNKSWNNHRQRPGWLVYIDIKSLSKEKVCVYYTYIYIYMFII